MIETHHVAARELDVPAGVEPIEWILLTSLVVEDFEDAWVVIGYYEKRWLIEEWHKLLKDGLPGDRTSIEDEASLGSDGGPVECGERTLAGKCNRPPVLSQTARHGR